MIWSNLIINIREFENFWAIRGKKSAKIGTILSKRSYSKSSSPLIKKEDYEILYGLMLGDLIISKKKNEDGLMRFEQPIYSQQFLEHLFKIFKYLCTPNASINFKDRRTFSTSSVYFTTRQSTSITEIFKLFYKKGKKTMPLNIDYLLTEKSLAYWAMDVGQDHKEGYILNTKGFTLMEVKMLQIILKDRWELETAIQPGYRLYIVPGSKKRFLKLICSDLHKSAVSSKIVWTTFAKYGNLII